MPLCRRLGGTDRPRTGRRLAERGDRHRALTNPLDDVVYSRVSNAAYLEVRERVGQNLSNLQEGITGVRVIQAYGREAEQERLTREAHALQEAGCFAIVIEGVPDEEEGAAR